MVFPVLAVLVLGAGSSTRAVEPWADRGLPVTGGLVLWLDASRQGAARAAESLPPIPSGGALDVGFDGSGLGHRLVQRLRTGRPVLITAGDRAVVRFDGRDDFLELAGPTRTVGAFTAFLVAAPRVNMGGFAAFLAGNAPSRSDYTSGFTIDLGPAPSSQFETLNVEGSGFGGAADLLSDVLPTGRFHTLEVRAQPGPAGVSLVVNGRAQGTRGQTPGVLRIDELTVGARYYTNEPDAPTTRGFFDGAIAEILLYDRALSDPECAAVRQYLSAKHAGLDEAMAPILLGGGKPLRTIANPPPVQVLVPGFEVRQLPLSLKNVNNVRYRPDGKLMALAYSGDVYLLTDRDGDGLEDHASLFWENQGRLRSPIGMALTPPGYAHGNGLFVASKGKCSLIVDTNGDDRADREIVVASGWTEIPHSVDALGVAFGKDGSVYFGLGAADYTNAYQLDSAGRAHYSLKSERGTIERVAPDFSSRTIIATGIRFPVALAFNRLGDLFGTDQEGATWLPNGNPFDELLHIQAGRHYGFPPRHSRHLPGVIDEPSVFDYAPQHQSTCGLVFNEPVAGGPVFGPKDWAGDALVCGYSRGKIFRTELAKTTSGYVARTALLACLGMLTVDACVAPDGSLVVSTHSGWPDWGSGPEGPGTLYKIRYADPAAAQPVLAWAESPREVRVAFDRPLDPDRMRGFSSTADITFGSFVAAGDRFETLRPGYAAVAAQTASPRFDLKVRAASVTPDRRTLVLAVDPQTEPVSYALTLPGLGRLARGSDSRVLPQEPAVDLSYDLTGVEATWRSSDGTAGWSGWLPHLDPAVSLAFTAGSAEHDRLWPHLERRGELSLAASLDLHNMLRPATQPGSKVDDTLPPEEVVLTFDASGPIQVHLPDDRGGTREAGGDQRAEVRLRPRAGAPLPIQLTLKTGGGPPRLDVSWHTAEDARPRALPLSRLILPWARSKSDPIPEAQPALAAELAGGDWLRGRRLFFSNAVRCSQCHTVRGEGGKIGPDLSNLVHRDVRSVLRDIREPSFAINPDYISYHIALEDGRTVSGPVRTQGETLLVGDDQGRVTPVARADVAEMKPQPLSTMPTGLADALGDAGLRDLLTFLLAPPLEPAPVRREGAPPERTAQEIDAVLNAIESAPVKRPRPLRIVLAAGPKDHGIDEHDYPRWQERWAKLLKLAEGVTVSTADGWPSPQDMKSADVLVWYSANPAWSAEKGPELDRFLARGGGMVYLHYAVNGRAAPEELAKRIGLAWRDGKSRFRHGAVDLAFRDGPKHPITAGFTRLHLVDESYWALIGDPAGIEVLASAVEEGKPQPLVWTRRQGRGRVFCSIPGHYSWTFDDPLFRILILRGIAWSAGEPADRFRALVTVGARVHSGGQ